MAKKHKVVRERIYRALFTVKYKDDPLDKTSEYHTGICFDLRALKSSITREKNSTDRYYNQKQIIKVTTQTALIEWTEL